MMSFWSLKLLLYFLLFFIFFISFFLSSSLFFIFLFFIFYYLIFDFVIHLRSEMDRAEISLDFPHPCSPAAELAPPTSSSPTATNNNSMQSAALLAHKARKGSLEAVVGKLHCKTAPASSSSSTASNPYLASDLYDDESEPVSKPPEVMLFSISFVRLG